MMKSQIIIKAIFIFFVCSNYLQAQAVFQKHFSDFVEYQKLATSPIDSTYIMACSRRDDAGLYDFCVAKVNKMGNLVWSKTYPSQNEDYLSSLSVSNKGDIFLAGYKLSVDGGFDFSLMKLDMVGNLEWYKTYQYTELDMSQFVGITTTGEIYLSGTIDNNKTTWVLKIDKEGNVLWQKMYDKSMYASALTKEDGLAILGPGYLTKISADGKAAWTTTISLTLPSGEEFDFDGISSLIQTKDGGFIFSSSTPHCTPALCSYRFAFVKMDGNGKVIWSRKEANKYTGFGKDAIETPDGGYAFIGQLSDIIGLEGNRLVVIKTDNKGSNMWAKSYGSSDSYGESANIELSYDGGLLFLGVEASKALLIKTDANGNSNCNEKTIMPIIQNGGSISGNPILAEKSISNTTTTFINSSSISLQLKDSLLCHTVLGVQMLSDINNYSLYPIPFHESINIEIKNKAQLLDNLTYTMYDVFGRSIIHLPVNEYEFTISTKNIHKGMYFYAFRVKDKIINSGKIIAD